MGPVFRGCGEGKRGSRWSPHPMDTDASFPAGCPRSPRLVAMVSTTPAWGLSGVGGRGARAGAPVRGSSEPREGLVGPTMLEKRVSTVASFCFVLQPRKIEEIKDFLLTARRKDAKCK